MLCVYDDILKLITSKLETAIAGAWGSVRCVEGRGRGGDRGEAAGRCDCATVRLWSSCADPHGTSHSHNFNHNLRHVSRRNSPDGHCSRHSGAEAGCLLCRWYTLLSMPAQSTLTLTTSPPQTTALIAQHGRTSGLRMAGCISSLPPNPLKLH